MVHHKLNLIADCVKSVTYVPKKKFLKHSEFGYSDSYEGSSDFYARDLFIFTCFVAGNCTSTDISMIMRISQSSISNSYSRFRDYRMNNDEAANLYIQTVNKIILKLKDESKIQLS